jgi:isoleucyl-tRNA synthetase
MKKAAAANFPEFEADMLKVWDKEKTFERSLKNREGAERFSFYDGPPFANGLPHYGHILAGTIKDSITRYKTMRGYYVPRRLGWDTHGLPVEYEVEKELKLSGKKAILEYGVGRFNQAARDSVFRYRDVFEDLYHRMGRWADMQNSYATLDDNYIESVWWVLSELHKKDLVYRGFRSNPYCPRCATPLSNFEVNQNYKDDTPDPSVYVKFDLPGHNEGKSLLAWTTTPWTLPANAALAVAADADYVEVELLDDGDSWRKGEKLILAKARLSVLDLKKAEYKIVNTVKGRDIVENIKPTYEPLYDLGESNEHSHRVYLDDSVSLEDGTGILHVAPRYGETDLALGLREHLPLIQSVDGNGQMVEEFKNVPGLESIAGRFFKDADDHIIADLTLRGRIFAAETFTHTYPFCWRCETPLMYFALETWYIKVAGLRDKLVANNDQVNWVPEHIKQGRFGNWLAEARDWNFSRNRFWGAPLPIWVNEDDENDTIVVGSLDELRELSGHDGDFDLHRPGIDEILIKRDGKTYRRIEEVFDCWFESGAMPYAEDHYPFEHKTEFKQTFPAQFIAEGLDQTRGWFYTLHVLGTALFDQPAFKNVIVNGLVLAADGKKLSKRLKNYPAPAEIFERYGADALRFFLMSSPVVGGEDVRFSADHVQEVSRNVFARLWNVHSFFTTYAEIDGWQPPKTLVEPQSEHLLDRWLLAKLNSTIAETTKWADAYQIARSVRPLRELIDDLSNWYVRRSRRRFWKSEDDTDKASAYATLHYVLVRIAQLLAPWSPFVADKLWRELTTGMDLADSVHLSDWPEAGKPDADAWLRMDEVRKIVEEGLAERAKAGIKVRQPLSQLKIILAATKLDGTPLKPEFNQNKYTADMKAIITEELNVKAVNVELVEISKIREAKKPVPRIELDTTISPELRREGMMRDVVRHIQSFRKTSGLAVEDRIELCLQTDDSELSKAISEHSQTIVAETLATIKESLESEHSTMVKVGDAELTITLKKQT